VHVGGQWVGLGEGDVDDEVARITDFIIRKWDRFDTVLIPGNRWFTPSLTAVIAELQGIYKANGTLTASFLPGVINLATKYALGYLKREIILPLYFSVEGHMSDMNVGPVAWVGDVLRHEGRALHFPTFYRNNTIPFQTQTGVLELARRVGQTVQDNGVKFPAGTPWVLGGFSEGALAIAKFYLNYLQPGQTLHWRAKDLRGVISAGSAYREKGVCAEWIPDPPARDHQGLSDVRLVNTPWWWKEIARKGDLYTDNESSGDRALFKTSIYKIVAEGKWSGGPAGFLSRVIDLLSPADDMLPVALAIFDGMRFAANMAPHGVYDMRPAAQFLRERLAAPPIAA
jgi:hypothetical protein